MGVERILMWTLLIIGSFEPEPGFFAAAGAFAVAAQLGRILDFAGETEEAEE